MSARKGSHTVLRFCDDSVEMMPKLISCSAAWATPRTEPASSVEAARTRLIRLNMQSTPSTDGQTGIGITGSNSGLGQSQRDFCLARTAWLLFGLRLD